MGMYDVFEPDPQIQCPYCDAPLRREWQGKEGPCGLLIWHQGHSAPVGQQGEPRWDQERLRAVRLPPRFELYTWCTTCGLMVFGEGLLEGDTWTRTELVHPAEHRATAKATDLGDRWRQCSECGDAWQADPANPWSYCRTCGAMTHLTKR